jgi:dCTP deaminase
MGLKPDHWIRRMALEHRMIEPFVDGQVRDGAISYGLSSYGYDIRVADEFKVFVAGPGDLTAVDPKRLDTAALRTKPQAMADFKGDVCVIPPNSFALGRSVEYFRVPRRILCVCLGKSTYARCGVIVSITPLEPEWEGTITLEISNTTPLPARVYGGEGIAQVLFFEADETCETSYADRRGKYQRQESIVLPRL